MVRNYLAVLSFLFVLGGSSLISAAPWNPDLNGDGVLDCADLNVVSSLSLLGLYIPTADYDCNGVIDPTDVANGDGLRGGIVLGPGRSFCPGDANLDGGVDMTDFTILRNNAFTTTFFYCDGDFNTDGIVDWADYLIWNTYRGGTC